MRAIALTGCVLALGLTGCFGFPPPPGFGGEYGGGDVDYKPISEKKFQYCQATEDFGYSTAKIDGQWQDYAKTFDVLTLEGGNATLTRIADDGALSTPASGTYTVDGTKVTIAWSDGKTETVDTYLEDIPGCEMLTPRSVEGAEPRISTEMYFERVKCDFSEAKQAEVTAQVR